MKTIYTMAAAATLILSAFAFAPTASAASAAGPNNAYCLSDDEGGSPWCGYATYAQCEEAASGTGTDCEVNVWRNERMPAYGHLRTSHE